MIKNLDEPAARELLKEKNFGHFGMILEIGDPYVVPVNYVYLEDEIYLHSLPGAKLDALRANGRVCLQVEKIETECRWQSAIAYGEFQEIKKTNEKIKILHEFNKRFERLTPVEAMSGQNRNPGGVIVFRIDVDRITGLAEI